MMTLTGGPVSNQVLQRGPDGTVDLHLAGTVSQAEGQSVEARVLRKGLPVANLDWQRIGAVEGQGWKGDIPAVPTGGPYRVEFRVGGQNVSLAIDDLLVGDLWILGGQSNMQGVGLLANASAPRAMIHNFELNDSWRVAEDPLHNFGDATDPIHWRLPALSLSRPLEGEELTTYMGRTVGAGLALPFAATMLERTGVPIGLIPCAHGGVSMDLWDPALADKGGESLYGSMLRRFHAVGGRVKGMLWYQGESDVSDTASAVFQTKFENFVAAVRRDFGQPDLPFYYVQIGRFVNPGGDEGWNRVQRIQLRLEEELAPGGMATSVDLALEDVIHLDTASLKQLGVRLANLVCHDLFPALVQFQRVLRGPRPVSACIEGNLIRVNFSQVNGLLRARGRIAGFSVHGAMGEELSVITKAEFEPDGLTVAIHLTPYNMPDGQFPLDMSLRYGCGKDPYCNVTDELDMGLPVFGPIPIQGVIL